MGQSGIDDGVVEGVEGVEGVDEGVDKSVVEGEIRNSRSRESTTRRGITVVVDVLLASLSADLDSLASLASFLCLAVSRAFAIAAFFLAACSCFAALRCCWAVCISSSCCGGGGAAMDDFNCANLSFIFCISALHSSLHKFTISSMVA